MAQETERKFLVRDDRWRLLAATTNSLVQFYLVTQPDRSVRVRVTDGARATLTLKFGRSRLVRDEYEYEIALAEARDLEAFASGRVIAKTRSTIRIGDAIFEVDAFERDLAGLVVAELEMPASGTWPTLPAWIGREVTGEPAYYNATLASGSMTWAAA